jgi:hypothetical protein
MAAALVGFERHRRSDTAMRIVYGRFVLLFHFG